MARSSHSGPTPQVLLRRVTTADLRGDGVPDIATANLGDNTAKHPARRHDNRWRTPERFVSGSGQQQINAA